MSSTAVSAGNDSFSRHKEKEHMDNNELQQPIHGSCSRYGRKRKNTSLAGFCILGRNGQYIDLISGETPVTAPTTKMTNAASPKAPAATALGVTAQSPEPRHCVSPDDDLSNEENMPLEQQLFVDTDLFRADAPPNLKTYKRKYQPLSPVAVLNTLPKPPCTLDIKQEVCVKQENIPHIEQAKYVIAKSSNGLVVAKKKRSRSIVAQEFQALEPHKQVEAKPKESIGVRIKQERQDYNEVQDEIVVPVKQEKVQEDETGQQTNVTGKPKTECKAMENQLKMVCEVKLREWKPCVVKTKQEQVPPAQFQLGDLVWARMSCYASFWPALLSCDNEWQDFLRPALDEGPRSYASYHVSFYGGKTANCSAWVTERNILPYRGSANLNFADTPYRQRLGSKASKIVICTGKAPIEMADSAMQLSRPERLLAFATWVAELKSQSSLRRLESAAKKSRLAAELAAQSAQEAASASATTDAAQSAQEAASASATPDAAQSAQEELKPEVRERGRRYLVVKTSASKRLRLSSPSPTREKCEAKPEEDVKPKVAARRGPPQSRLTIKTVYDKRRLADMPTSKVCEKCLKTGKMLTCTICRRTVHKTCDKVQLNTYVCGRCRSDLPCDLCNEGAEKKLLKCTSKACSKSYHSDCIKGWNQAKHDYNDSLLCPYHTCHTCVSDDPGSQRLFVPSEHLLRCIYCPTSYHSADTCIPAAARVLSSTQCVCPKHPFKLQTRKALQAYTTNWCFACTDGGFLAVCDTCPTTYHPACLARTCAASASNHCSECESGNFPVCGQIVWAKHSNYRWWPSRIAFPDEVPHLYDQLKHNYNEFVVQFLGSNDHAWSSNKRVFSYIPEDNNSEKKKLTENKFEKKFKLGLEEAGKMYTETVKARLLARNALYQQPPTYQSIKVNRIMSSSIRTRMQEIAKATSEGSDRCSCSDESPNPCSFGTGCINRDLCVECGLDCPAGDACQNRMFSNCQYAPVKPVLTPHCGWGLAASENIKEGDFVIEYVGDVIDEAELQVRIQKMQMNQDKNFYFLAVEGQLYIDAGPRGNHARFMNHSCEPNCKVDKWIARNEIRMGLFATKNIPQNTELTFNYNLQLFGDETQACFCGGESCSGFIGSKAKAKKSVQEVPVPKPKPRLPPKPKKRANGKSKKK